MSPELIRAALVFLQRTDIKGGEAVIMMRVCQALEMLAMADNTAAGMPRAIRPNGPMPLGEGSQE